VSVERENQMVNIRDLVSKNDYKSVRDHKVFDERLNEALKEVENLKKERDILLSKINNDVTKQNTISVDDKTAKQY
jgi:hypothetical protein